MSKGVITKQYLQDIADAIKSRTGFLNKYKPSEMAQEIYNITTHRVPVQITDVQNVSGLYLFNIIIENDMPDKYPNLLYSGETIQCNLNLQSKTITSSYINDIFNICNNVYFSSGIDENHIRAYCISYEDPRNKQYYVIYGKSKG